MNNQNTKNTVALLLAWVAASGWAWGQEKTVAFSLADQLERAIYLQEAEADVDSAVVVYEGILADTELVSALAAEARYRLAMCYLDQGKRELALATLQRLVEEHPDEARWVEAAKEVLPKEFTPEITPWTDGERSHFTWTTLAGLDVGKSYILYREFEWEGRALWRQETRAFLNGNRASAVEFDPETFKSVYSKMQMPEVGAIDCWYADDALSVKVAYEKTGQDKSFTFRKQVYDNEHAYALMRQLPLEKGYSMEATIFVTVSGVHLPIRFTVADIAPMSTALGEVDCYRVDLDLPGAQQSFYFTADDRRLMTKVQVGGVEGKLTKVDRIQEGVEVEYLDSEYGFGLTHIDDWVVAKGPPRGGTRESRLHFLDPANEGGYTLYSDVNSKIQDASSLSSIDAFTAYIINEEQLRMEGEYDFAGTHREAFEINGMPAKAYKLQRPQGDWGVALERYTYVVLGKERHYIAHAFLRPDLAKEKLPVFERMVLSLRE